jgi:serine protease inhibitor
MWMKPYARNGFSVKSNYTTTLQRIYNAKMTQLDFDYAEATADHINEDVSTATHGLIKELVSPDLINSDTM